MIRLLVLVPAFVLALALLDYPDDAPDPGAKEPPERMKAGNAALTANWKESRKRKVEGKTHDGLLVDVKVEEDADASVVAARREHAGVTYQFHPDRVAEVDREVKRTGDRSLYMAGWVVKPPELPSQAKLVDAEGTALYVAEAAFYLGGENRSVAQYFIDWDGLEFSDKLEYWLEIEVACFRITSDPGSVIGTETFRVRVDAPYGCCCGGQPTACGHCQRGMVISRGKTRRKGCPQLQNLPEAGCCRNPVFRNAGKCPGGALPNQNTRGIVSCGSIAQDSAPTSEDAGGWLADHFRIGVYCGGKGHCLVERHTNVNEIGFWMRCPQNLAACAAEIDGARCSGGGCCSSECCIAKLGQGKDANWYGGWFGSGGCYPGEVGRNGCYTPVEPIDKGCLVGFTGSCACRLPCGEGYTAVRGSGPGSVKFETVKCGSTSCAYVGSAGEPCLGDQKWHPCFCYTIGTK